MIEIKKPIRAFVRNRNAANTEWEFPTLGDPYPDHYTKLGGPTGNFFFTENTIDIGGLTDVQDKALQVANVQVYQSTAYAAGAGINPTNNLSADGKMFEWVFVTDVPFDVQKWRTGIDVSLLEYRLPGVFTDMIEATVKTLSTDQILFGRFRRLSNNIETELNTALMLDESYFGDAMQTMSSKLYVYRCFQFVGAPTVIDQLRGPELEIVINGVASELGDLQQIMELRRSYLTQQTIA